MAQYSDTRTPCREKFHQDEADRLLGSGKIEAISTEISVIMV